METKSMPMLVSYESRPRRCRAHDDGAQRAPDQHRSAEHGREGDAGEHAVGERLAEEGHPADDHPRADDPAEHGDEAAAEEGALEEVERERLDDRGGVGGHEHRP
jgi:hypothetical protein